MGIAIEEIISKDNQFIKLALALHDKKTRYEKNLFLVEGFQLLDEAIKKNIKIKYIFVNETSLKTIQERDPSVENIFLVPDNLLAKISTTENAAPVVFIAEMLIKSKINYQAQARFLFCEDINDPGNLGSIIRTAWASGVAAIYLSPNCVDIYNPKVLRSSVGTVFYGPICYQSLEDTINELKSESQKESMSLEVLGTTPYTDINYQDLKFPAHKKLLILVGNESRGLSEEAKNHCTQLIKIPLENSVESINVLAATAVLLFGIKR